MHEKNRARRAFPDSRQLLIRDIPIWKDAVPAELSVAGVDDFISAGWLLSKMDLAGGKTAHSYIGGRAVTVALDAISFPRPVLVGDTVSFYTEIIKQGRTSLTILCESWAERRKSKAWEKVTEGVFTFVALGASGEPVPIERKRPATGGEVPGCGAGEAGGKVSVKPSSPRRVETIPPEEPTLTRTATTRDRNYYRDIFGGWLLEYMDLAGLKAVQAETGFLGATRGIEAMVFKQAVNVGDVVSFYTERVKTGTTSVTIRVDAWASRQEGKKEKVTEGLFTYVALDQKRNPVPVS